MDVAGRVEQRLLVVVLKAERQVVVRHIVHVGLVDAHAKGVGRHHHAGAVVEEVLLVALTLLGGQAGVVARGGKPLVAQQVTHFFHGAPARAVDNP